MFAPQEILLGKTPLVKKLRYSGFKVPKDFYEKGYCVIEDIPSIKQAQVQLEKCIASIDTEKLRYLGSIINRVQLAKIDEIPVCADVVSGSYQVLHFDMGQPIISDTPQNMYIFTGLYLDSKKAPVKAKTRVASLRGFFKDSKWGTQKQIEQKLIDYAQKYGDGWFQPTVVNTQRLACFARVVDALSESPELTDYIDKTMGQWFRDEKNLSADESLQNEYEYYDRHGIDLEPLEEQVLLQPGQLLLIDNTRVIHGRLGQRGEKEIWQIMYGLKDATPQDINGFRKQLVKLVKEDLA